jgi:hypothetical protein
VDRRDAQAEHQSSSTSSSTPSPTTLPSPSIYKPKAKACICWLVEQRRRGGRQVQEGSHVRANFCSGDPVWVGEFKEVYRFRLHKGVAFSPDDGILVSKRTTFPILLPSASHSLWRTVRIISKANGRVWSYLFPIPSRHPHASSSRTVGTSYERGVRQ